LNITKHPATNETQANNSKCLKKYGYLNRAPLKNKEDEIVINASAKHNLKTESFVIGQNIETRNSEALKQVRKIIALGSVVLILNFVRATISRVN